MINDNFFSDFDKLEGCDLLVNWSQDFIYEILLNHNFFLENYLYLKKYDYSINEEEELKIKAIHLPNNSSDYGLTTDSGERIFFAYDEYEKKGEEPIGSPLLLKLVEMVEVLYGATIVFLPFPYKINRIPHQKNKTTDKNNSFPNSGIDFILVDGGNWGVNYAHFQLRLASDNGMQRLKIFIQSPHLRPERYVFRYILESQFDASCRDQRIVFDKTTCIDSFYIGESFDTYLEYSENENKSEYSVKFSVDNDKKYPLGYAVEYDSNSKRGLSPSSLDSQFFYQDDQNLLPSFYIYGRMCGRPIPQGVKFTKAWKPKDETRQGTLVLSGKALLSWFSVAICNALKSSTDSIILIDDKSIQIPIPDDDENPFSNYEYVKVVGLLTEEDESLFCNVFFSAKKTSFFNNDGCIQFFFNGQLSGGCKLVLKWTSKHLTIINTFIEQLNQALKQAGQMAEEEKGILVDVSRIKFSLPEKDDLILKDFRIEDSSIVFDISHKD